MVIGGRGERSEVPLVRNLVPLLRAGMLLLADRAYDAANLLNEIGAPGAHFLVRGNASRKLAVGEVLPDGSYLSEIDDPSESGRLKVRSSRRTLTCTALTGPGSGTATA